MARPPKKERGLYTRTDANGKLWWYYRIYLAGREQRGGPYETKGEAKDARETLASDHRHGKIDPHGGWQKIEEIFARHLALRATRKDQRSQHRFAMWWKARCHAAGLARVKELSPRFLQTVRDELATPVAERAAHPESRRAGATINRYFRWLHAALESVKMTQRQLFDHWTWESESKGRTRHLSLAEETTLAHELGPYASWMRLAILTGLRQAEQFTMQWKDVDLDRRLVTLPQTKAGPVQYIHLSDEAVTILRSFDSWQRSKWVFPSENPAAPLDARNFYNRIWTPAVLRAGIERARWHDLRHTGASRLAESGANANTIADFLRHSGLMLVRRYAHLSQPHLQAAAELVSRFGQGLNNLPEQTGKKPETGKPNG